VAEKQARATIVAALQHRSRSMSPGARKAEIDLTDMSAAGDAGAPITLVEYACPRCPYCAWITPDIHSSVLKGPLQGKVKMYLKTFPIRGHRYGTETGFAFVAAEKLGRFWEFVLHYYQRYEEYSGRELLDWAEAVGMDPVAFEKALSDPATRESLVEIKKEGIVGGVNSTPTFFINGRKYRGELTAEELTDVLEEAFDRTNGVRYRQ
jgi:protein-disulfide isomerase